MRIEAWYLPDISVFTGDKRPDAPLRSRNHFAIGFGDSGAKPWVFKIRDDLNIEVGYLKVYLATYPVDLRHMEQPSPFGKHIPRAGGETKTANFPEMWGTRTAIIIQKRKGTHIEEKSEFVLTTDIGDAVEGDGALPQEPESAKSPPKDTPEIDNEAEEYLNPSAPTVMDANAESSVETGETPVDKPAETIQSPDSQGEGEGETSPHPGAMSSNTEQEGRRYWISSLFSCWHL